MKKAVLVAVLVAIAAGGWRILGPQGPAGPVLSTAFERLDQDVRAPIQEAIDRVRAQPLDAALRAELAMLYQANGLVDAVDAAYLQALELDPAQARWWYLLALHRRQQADLERAVEACLETIRLDPSYTAARRSLGGMLIDLGRIDEARGVFEKACQDEPEHGANRVGLARVHLQLENWAEAVRLLEGVTERQSRYGYAYMLLGRAYLGAGEREKARIASSRGAGALPPAFDPWAVDLLTRRAGFSGVMKETERLFQENREDEAIRLLVRLREDHPDSPLLLSNLGAAYGRQKDYDSMLAVLMHSLRYNPDHVSTHLNLSYAYLRKENSRAALEHIDRAIELNSVLATAHAHRCEVLVALGRMDDARVAIETAIELDGSGSRSRLRLGQLLYETGEFEEAAETLARLTEAYPDSVKGLHWLARSLIAAGRIDGARIALDNARKVNAAHWGHAVIEEMLDEQAGQ